MHGKQMFVSAPAQVVDCAGDGFCAAEEETAGANSILSCIKITVWPICQALTYTSPILLDAEFALLPASKSHHYYGGIAVEGSE